MDKLFLTIIFAIAIVSAIELNVTITKSNITQYHVYPNYGQGDIAFELNNLPIGTKGVYLAGSELGTKSSYAAILSSISNGDKIKLYYDVNSRWTGSSSIYYKISTVCVIPQ